MEKNKSRLRAGIFLDLNNISKEIKKKSQNYVIDYRKLKEKMALNYTLKEACAFVAVSTPMKPKNSMFIKYLDNVAGFIPMQSPLATKRDGTPKQEETDMFMHEYISSRSEDFDVIILGSGDVHFLILIKMLLSQYKIVVVWSWKNSLSPSVRKTVGDDYIHYIDEIWKDIRKLKQKNSLYNC
ncbi:hypothetical protein LCGC14_1051240 [marine sediment metagenome]|uniref:NYN domain-containing protein n=1 Tax=marine sediment metagenome TaxID=412755 RepID=A0A0F9Q6X3_9ZZZZ